MHDWTLVDAGIFHSFHTTWIRQINTALNAGLLPQGYYALAEQHAGESIADVLTLHTNENHLPSQRTPPATGGTLVAEAPPRVRRRQTLPVPTTLRPRTIAIRHVSDQLVAMIEIVSPANKDRAQHVKSFAAKAVEALDAGVHLLIVDLFPRDRFDPHGVHGEIREQLGLVDEPYEFPANEPLTLDAYVAGSPVEVYLEHLAPGATLIEMPLFLRRDGYVATPLEATYLAAYKGVPSVWRDVLEGRARATR